MIRSTAMRLSFALIALLCWPIAVWHSFQARRRLRAYLLPSGDHRLTLERVA